MNITLLSQNEQYDNNSFIIPVFKNGNNAHLTEEFKGVVNDLLRNKKFKGDLEEIFILNFIKKGKFNTILFLGMGNENELESESIRRGISKAVKKAIELKLSELNILLFNNINLSYKRIVELIVESSILSKYTFDKYKTDKKVFEISKINLLQEGLDENIKKCIKDGIEEAKILAETTIVARELINEPSNKLDPSKLAENAKRAGEQYGFETDILNREQIRELNMEAFLSVAQGAINEPKLIVMRYFGDNDNKEILGYVGKGLTYDSGGYSLKPSSSMETMKSDMAGGAAVIGAISAIAKRKLKINIVAVIAACENLLSDKAYKPGDIINSMGRKTVEVVNTDAEGRLTLIDAVYYTIHKEKVTQILDIATLTGAVYSALGRVCTGVITNQEKFLDKLKNASDLSGEKIWELPVFKEYKQQLKSDVADLKNSGSKGAGTIVAGLFIGEFIDNIPWLHMDIAGTSWSDDSKYYYSKGATGVGVRTLYYLAKLMSEENI
ncbi:leucyl aminopeptidase [Hathewaya limosa]|uniref:Probable cytosol aminopeptidase n=1 Tax=Hathewaya limosa TaxID=1536 RepID=A0ABU0JVA9_HATLI|nr:leucyl aminopeptidase [Hathewaya limosa]MDQ0479979.1 leucyl aminopeptidase [Hathewaya limosa]